MTKATLPLAELARGELEFLRKAIGKGQLATPLTETGLDAIGKGKLYWKIGPLADAGREVALALLDLALAAGDAPAPATAKAAASLVWSGPAVSQSPSRPTTAVLLELLSSAKERVLVAGYEFDHGAVIFGPLHKAMVARGVKVSIYLDVRAAPSPKSDMDAYLAVQTHRFLKRNWPFGAPVPKLYCFPAGCAHGSRASLHAKCVVIDGRYVLVGSANFTKRGHTRNLEVGVSFEDPAFAAALTNQFDRLVEGGDLAELPVASVSREAPPAAAEDDEDIPEAGGILGVSAFDALATELLVSEVARPLFVRLLGSAAPVPTVGEDVEGDQGEVIGSPELSWGVPRVAVLLPEQEGSRKKLEAAGWTCFSTALGDDDYSALCDLIRGEG
jgi:hypothetical protein